jgi:hypothetical protein
MWRAKILYLIFNLIDDSITPLAIPLGVWIPSTRVRVLWRVKFSYPYPYPHIPLAHTPGGMNTLDNH